jgi:ribosomal protein S18 acetylase RimI-like enzyme
LKEAIKNIELFNQLLNKYLNKDYLNNADRLIRDYRNFIENKKLYFIEKDDNLFFLEDCIEFYNLYYFISKINTSVDIVDLNFEKTIVADIIYIENNLDEAVPILIKLGFGKYLTRNYQTLKLSQKNVELNSRIKFSAKEDVDFIFEMQAKYIDKYTGNILSKEDLLRATENNLILSIYESNNCAGYLRFTINKKNIFLEGIAVDRKFRGKGYAKELVQYFIDYFSKEGYNKIDLWVRDDNISALKLYEFFNFKNTKYKCDNYIKY